jgi:hypothetical protein
MPDYTRQFAFIAKCNVPEELRRLIKNARGGGAGEVADAAFKKLVSILPAQRPGTLEHDFWQTLFAFEHMLTEERGKTTRLARTRQKVERVGVLQTLRDWAVDKNEADGFRMLLDRSKSELTGEAIILRHAVQFEEHVVRAAEQRLTRAGVDVAQLPRSPEP